MISVEDAETRISVLQRKHEGRRSKMESLLALSRNNDPRESLNNTLKWSRLDKEDLDKTLLKTNEPRTYLDLAVHMLAGRPISWVLPRLANPAPAESEASGIAERFVKSVFEANDAELAASQRQRLLHTAMDSAARFGMVAIYRQAFQQNGETVFLLEPWDPRQVSERADRRGLAELTRVYELTAREIIDENPGWNLEGIRRVAATSPDQVFRIADYWHREIKSGGGLEISNVVIAFPGDSTTREQRQVLRGPVVEPRESSIPVDVQLFNGEPFGRGEFLAQSILEPNFWVYLHESDLMGKIDKHIDQTLARVVQEFVHGRRPVADPKKILVPGAQSITSYDSSRGERGMNIVPMNPLDQAIQLRVAQISDNRQKGSAPSMLHGTLNFTLSGFAISQLLEAALAVVAETQAVGEIMFSRIGKWVLETFKETGVKRSIVTALPGVVRRGYRVEDVSPDMIPDFTDIRAHITLARPNDFLERVNIARQALPDRRAFFTLDTVHETLFTEEVPDPSREQDGIELENLEQLPEVQIERAIMKMERRAKQLEGSDPEEADFWKRSAERLAQRAVSQSPPGVVNAPAVTTRPDTRTLSTPAATTQQ